MDLELILILGILVAIPIGMYFKPGVEILLGGLALASLVGWWWKRGWNAETFQDASGAEGFQNDTSKVVLEQEVERPYALDPIRSVDDYEYNMVFQNEGNRGITKRQRDALMARYPMHWTTQPPSSELFQQGLAAYEEEKKEAFENPPPAGKNPYAQVDGSNMTPPDTLEAEKKEREILATYTPKDPQKLTTYDAADAQELIQKIYDAKGLVPSVKQTGPNQFTILSTMKKGEEVKWEDDPATPPQAVSDVAPQAGQGEGTIVVPAVAQEVHTGLDPFYTADASSRDGKWNYTKWTPGLERMFAPTEPQTNWY